MADVVDVVAQPFFKAGVATPAVDLSEAREAGLHRVADVVVRVFLAKLARELRTFRAWADETHVAAKDIPELWQFVEARAPQVIADPGAAGIAGHRPDRAQIAFRVGMHGANFQDRKATASESNAHLPVKHRPAVGEANGDRNCGKKRREHDQRAGRQRNVDYSFCKTGHAGDRLMPAEAR